MGSFDLDLLCCCCCCCSRVPRLRSNAAVIFGANRNVCANADFWLKIPPNPWQLNRQCLNLFEKPTACCSGPHRCPISSFILTCHILGPPQHHHPNNNSKMAGEGSQQQEPSQLLANLAEHIQEHKAVTYKWLAREYSLPANYAKQLLFRFVEEQGSKIRAVYAVSGCCQGDEGGQQQRVVRLVPSAQLQACCGQLQEGTMSVHIHRWVATTAQLHQQQQVACVPPRHARHQPPCCSYWCLQRAAISRRLQAGAGSPVCRGCRAVPALLPGGCVCVCVCVWCVQQNSMRA